ncbi:2910_t:CDS:10 [Paraglomus occultum]|uniref:2910_t:CDS:1 n=1 Tax=Paraglomus occultum TaxID=144539 RepID=A0A9N9G2J4_9GLOM|nr:2910_t:CDS:10 [Paraglomus occultum]
MTATKYVSLPSTDFDADTHNYPPSQHLGSSSSNSRSQREHDDDDSFDESDSYVLSNMRGKNSERERILKGRGDEDDTVVDVEENEHLRAVKEPRGLKPINPCLLITTIFVIAWVGAAIAYAVFGGTPHDEVAANGIRFRDAIGGRFIPSWRVLEWSRTTSEDGFFTYKDDSGNIILENIANNTKTIFVPGKDIVDSLGQRIDYFSFSVSPDSQYVLLGTNKTKLWRHSIRANYWVYDISSKVAKPLTNQIGDNKHALIAYAKWSPSGHSVAFVKDNDLYISVDLKEERRITFDNSVDIFNGIPDWIYEEEVLSSNNALWWSPSGKYLAYLRFNETAVPEYRFPIYLDNRDGAYTSDYVIRYPKPGFPNPIVTLHIYNTEIPLVAQSDPVIIKEDFEDDDRIITEVAWIGNENVLMREMNRVQDNMRVVLVDVETRKGVIVREENSEEQDGGWIRVAQTIVAIPSKTLKEKDSYIDVVNNNGYLHLALFSPLQSDKPTFLTSGNWEVVNGVTAIDHERRLIYFVSTEKSSMERHLYSIKFDGTDKKALTPTDQPGYYSADFSPGCTYYSLQYEGPDVPWQKIYKVDDKNFEIVLETNNHIKSALVGLDMPTKRFLTIDSEGYQLNAFEIRPPGMDTSGQTKYPVLFNVYGGPDSQLVSTKFSINWHMFLASSPLLKYIIVTVDGRGTGFKGRAFRVGIRKQLGKLETIDQINAGKYWAQLNYVDKEKMAIWGWSYGGYMTSKVIEADSGVFKLGMAVAPVTDWRFYDSIYTERYMTTPAMNADGYLRSSVTNMTGFRHAKFLLVHGTGDGKTRCYLGSDNVHFQNTAHLIDKLTLASIHNYRVQIYTDSDHSINKNNANRELYYLLTDYLRRNFGSDGNTAWNEEENWYKRQ